jgi:hypothetical protein
MKEALVMAAMVGGTLAFIRVCLFFGYRYIDKMLCVPPPVDLNKPIVLAAPPVHANQGAGR